VVIGRAFPAPALSAFTLNMLPNVSEWSPCEYSDGRYSVPSLSSLGYWKPYASSVSSIRAGWFNLSNRCGIVCLDPTVETLLVPVLDVNPVSPLLWLSPKALAGLAQGGCYTRLPLPLMQTVRALIGHCKRFRQFFLVLLDVSLDLLAHLYQKC